MKNSELSTSMSLAGVADMDQAGVDGKIICILLHTRFPVIYYIGRCRTYERGLPLLVNRGLRAESGCRPALPPSKPLAPRSHRGSRQRPGSYVLIACVPVVFG